MDWQKTAIIGGMAGIAFLLLQEWSDFSERHQPQQDNTTITAPVADTTTQVTQQASNIDDIPVAGKVEQEQPSIAASQQLVEVKTDVLDILINTQGGDIVKVGLPQHWEKLDTPDKPYILLNQTQNFTYIAQSGLVGVNGTDTKSRPVYRTSNSNFAMSDDKDTLQVDLLLEQDGVSITKRFSFKRGEYLVGVEYIINNTTANSWQANMFAQIKRDDTPVKADVGIGVTPYLGAALTTPEENYKKVDFDDLDEKAFKADVKGGWVSLVQHYFISAWVADPNTINSYSLRKLSNSNQYVLGYVTAPTVIAPGQQGSIEASFYAGPKDIDYLENVAPYLDLTVDYGWLWMIAKPMFQMGLKPLESFLGNWGWAIVIFTILIKLALFPLSAKAYRSMANMRKLQPLMEDLKARYGDNRQKMSEEMMKMYKREKINPMGGCLPMLLQMPIFLALYWVLLESVELRHAPFTLWITDLSVKDPYFILPVIMSLTMWATMRMNPAPSDPTAAKMMQWMPWVFGLMFLWFPAGLVLYWVVNNTFSMIQQFYITRSITKDSETK